MHVRQSSPHSNEGRRGSYWIEPAELVRFIVRLEGRYDSVDLHPQQSYRCFQLAQYTQVGPGDGPAFSTLTVM
jgi:hypothetical protein